MDEFSKQLHKQKRKKFPRRTVDAFYVGDIIEIDLVDMSNIKSSNNNTTFLLNCIDIYSRYVWSFPLLNKSAKTVLDHFKKIPIEIKNVFSDRGKEFFNDQFKRYCEQKNINHYTTYSEIKCPHVERFNRTLKSKMYVHFDRNQTTKYIHVLEKLIKDYNYKVHSVTKEKPIDVLTKNIDPSKKKRKIRKEDNKIKIGDYVRISRLKKTFEKGYTQNWSEEVFKVYNIDRNDSPSMYDIKDLLDEKIDGKFYAEELQVIPKDFKDFALVEKVLRRRGNKVYVSYIGYSDKFNQWIDKSQLENI